MLLQCCNQVKNTKEMSIFLTVTVQLKKPNKTCLPEAYATQKSRCDLGVISLKSGTVVIEGTTVQAYL